MKVTWPEGGFNALGIRVFSEPIALEYFENAGAGAPPTHGWIVPTFLTDQDHLEYVLLKSLCAVWSFPSTFQLTKNIARGTGTKKADFLKHTTSSLNTQLLSAGVIEESDCKFKLAYVDISWLYLKVGTALTQSPNYDPYDAVREYVREDRKKRRSEMEPEFKITVNQVFPQYGDTQTVDFTHSAFNTLTNVLKYNLYSSTPAYSKFLPNSKMSAAELEMLVKDADYAEVELSAEMLSSMGGSATITPGSSSTGTAALVNGTGSGSGPSSGANVATASTSASAANAATTTVATAAPKRRKPLGRSKKYNTNIDPNSIDLTESLMPGQGFIPEFNVNHLCKVPNYYITTNTVSAVNAPGGVSIIKPNSLTNVGAENASTASASENGADGSSSGFPGSGAPSGAASTPSNGPPAAVKKLFGGSAMFHENGVKFAKSVQQLLVGTNSDVSDSNLSKYYYTLTYRGPGSGNYKDAALINKINKIPTTNPFTSIKILKTPHKNAAKLAQRKLASHFKPETSVKGFVHDLFTKELIKKTLGKQSDFVADCSNLEMLHNNLQFNVLLNAYRDISEETWNNYYKFKLVDYDQLGMKQRERNERDRYNYAVKAAAEAEEAAKAKFAEEKEEHDQRVRDIKEAHEKALQESMENDDVSPPSSPDIPAFEPTPAPPPIALPLPPPQFKLASRYTSPTAYPEILRHLPVELRDGESKDAEGQLEYFDSIPTIKGPLDIRATYPDTMNPQLLTQVEVVRIPNSNNIGWENIKRYRDRR